MLNVTSPQNLADQLTELHPFGWWFSRLSEKGMQITDGRGMYYPEVPVSYQHVDECDFEECTLKEVGKIFRSEYYLYALWVEDQFIGFINYEGLSSDGKVWRVSTPGTELNVSREQIESACWDSD